MEKIKLFFSAGEASGDLHAGALMAALVRESASRGAAVEFTYLGGDEMERAAGCPPVVHYREMAFMGFADVLRNLGKVRRNLGAAIRAMERTRPDAVVLVDYPSFNLRLARHAFSMGIPVYYFIAPKVWAWKKWRVRQLRRYCRKVLSILPFETDFFRNHGVEVEYVGNPSVAEVDERLRHTPERSGLCLRAGLAADTPYLLLAPGSRRSEIAKNLPVMLAAAAGAPQYPVIIAAAPGIEPEYYRAFTQAPMLAGETFALMARAEAALVTSGTATLECTLCGTPQVVCYRGGGSRLVYNIMKRILTIPYVSLPNLIVSEEIVPEMLMHLCTPDAVRRRLLDILPGAPGRDAQLRGYADLRRRLTGSDAPARAARAIIDGLPE